MPSVLITGASRGIGLELTRQYAANGWRVFATCREPASAAALQALAGPDVTLHALDVTDLAGIDALAAELDGQPLDVLFNNAGVGAARIAFGAIDYARWDTLMRTNVYGPTHMAEAFLPNLMAGEQKKIVAVSSSLGSIEGTKGGNYLYRSSKAALNMVFRSMAMDLKPQGITVTLLSPGVVDTDFTRGAQMPKISVQESAAGLIAVVGRLGPDDTGAFIRYNGGSVGW